MTLFWKASAAILVAQILILALDKQQRDMGVLVAIAACCITAIAALEFLEPVVDFLYEIQSLSRLDAGILRTLLQIVGVGFTSELIAMICADAGNASLGKSIQFLASSVILYWSIPVFESMLDLIRDILGGL